MELLIAAATALTLAAQPPKSSTIEVTYEGISDLGQQDFAIAAETWERCLISDAPIRITVTGIERGPTGFAYQNVVRNKRYLPKRDVWYPTALAGALRGRRVTDQADIHIFLRETMGDESRHYSANDPIEGEDQVDFINVSLHEIAHGLGISSGSFVPWQGEPIGSIGLPNDYVNYFDYAFDLHEQDGTPLIYDTHLHLAGGRKIAGDFENPSVELTMAMANPTVHFRGANAELANDGFPVGVTPLNLSHIPAFPRRATPIMLSNSGRGESIRHPDQILLGMLMDLGWQITDSCYEKGA